MPCLWTIETTTEVLLIRMHNPPHPGEVLRDYLGGVSITDAAKHLGVTRAALSRILNECTVVLTLRSSRDLALRNVHPSVQNAPDQMKQPMWIAPMVDCSQTRD